MALQAAAGLEKRMSAGGDVPPSAQLHVKVPEKFLPLNELNDKLGGIVVTAALALMGMIAHDNRATATTNCACNTLRQ